MLLRPRLRFRAGRGGHVGIVFAQHDAAHRPVVGPGAAGARAFGRVAAAGACGGRPVLGPGRVAARRRRGASGRASSSAANSYSGSSRARKRNLKRHLGQVANTDLAGTLSSATSRLNPHCGQMISMGTTLWAQ